MQFCIPDIGVSNCASISSLAHVKLSLRNAETYLSAEKYLREVWPAVTRSLKELGIGCELNLVSAIACNTHLLLTLPEQRGLHFAIWLVLCRLRDQ